MRGFYNAKKNKHTRLLSTTNTYTNITGLTPGSTYIFVVKSCAQTKDGLHKTKSRVVNAKVQAKMAEALLEELTEEELACYKRGRNAKSHTAAKNASIAEYRKATGLEALFGYLYLLGKEERILELTKMGLEKVDVNI